MSEMPNLDTVNRTEASSEITMAEPTTVEGEIIEDEESPVEEALLDKYLERIEEVTQSEAVRRAWLRVLEYLKQFSLQDPLAYEMLGKIYEEVRDFVKLPEEDVQEFEAGNWEPIPISEDDIFSLEPQEKLFGRFSVYQNALMYMAEHFETLRPLLAEIKQAYEDVLEKCEKEWNDLDKDRLEHLRLKETFAQHVRQKDKEGDIALMNVHIQAHALQEQLQSQQHILDTFLGMLWKMRQSLKMQSKSVEKRTVVYKTKIEALAKEIVSQQGNKYEMTLPGKYTEMMERFKQIKDPREIRRILQGARRQLKKAHRQIMMYEADFWKLTKPIPDS